MCSPAKIRPYFSAPFRREPPPFRFRHNPLIGCLPGRCMYPPQNICLRGCSLFCLKFHAHIVPFPSAFTQPLHQKKGPWALLSLSSLHAKHYGGHIVSSLRPLPRHGQQPFRRNSRAGRSFHLPQPLWQFLRRHQIGNAVAQ